MTDQHDELAEKVAALQEEVEQLRQAVVSHAVVDQAIGVVVAMSRLGPEQGWEVLRNVSQHTNTKLRDVARHVVRSAHEGGLPQHIDHALRAVLVDARRAQNGRPPLRREGTNTECCGSTG
jgi:hypothetical protein